MPTAVYDASYITFRKRAGVMAAYKSTIDTALNSQNLLVRKEQPTFQSGEIITTRKQGGCICTENNLGQSFNRQGPGACGCAR
jgi:hypothetical protein